MVRDGTAFLIGKSFQVKIKADFKPFFSIALISVTLCQGQEGMVECFFTKKANIQHLLCFRQLSI